MTLRIEAGWNTVVVGAMTATFNDGTAEVVSLTGTFCHTDMSPVLASGLYVELANALETKLNSAMTETFTVTYSTSTLAYTISASGNFSVDFTADAASVRLGNALGFNTAKSGAGSYVSDVRPYYLIDTTVGAKSAVSDDYEPEGITEGAESDDGSTYAESRAASPTLHDFLIPFEARSQVFERAAVASVPWTFQAFYRLVRGAEPFLVIDPTESTVHKLKPKSASFAPSRVAEDWDDLWNIDMKTYVLGRL